MRYILTIFAFIWSVPSLAIDYTQAREKAIEAAMLQTGLTENINRLRSYGEEQASKYVDKIGIRAPVNILLFAYVVYRDKELHVPYKGHRLTLAQDSVRLDFRFWW